MLVVGKALRSAPLGIRVKRFLYDDHPFWCFLNNPAKVHNDDPIAHKLNYREVVTDKHVGEVSFSPSGREGGSGSALEYSRRGRSLLRQGR
jgi:hypothetical protein